jgi:hypothetical protein
MSRIAQGSARCRAVRARCTVLMLAALVAGLALSVAALAAKPKHGAHFRGRTSASPVNGFLAPVTFTVSLNGRSLANFQYSSFGCFGAGGFQPGIDYYTKPSAIHKVGSVRVSADGRLSATHSVSAFTSSGSTTTTTTSVTGRFTKPNRATGSITFSQKVAGAFSSSCGPATLSFSASAP